MSFFNSNKVPSSGPTFSFFSNKKESNKKVDAGENSEKIAEENNLRSSFYEQPANPTGIHGDEAIASRSTNDTDEACALDEAITPISDTKKKKRVRFDESSLIHISDSGDHEQFLQAAKRFQNGKAYYPSNCAIEEKREDFLHNDEIIVGPSTENTIDDLERDVGHLECALEENSELGCDSADDIPERKAITAAPTAKITDATPPRKQFMVAPKLKISPITGRTPDARTEPIQLAQKRKREDVRESNIEMGKDAEGGEATGGNETQTGRIHTTVESMFDDKKSYYTASDSKDISSFDGAKYSKRSQSRKEVGECLSNNSCAFYAQDEISIDVSTLGFKIQECRDETVYIREDVKEKKFDVMQSFASLCMQDKVAFYPLSLLEVEEKLGRMSKQLAALQRYYSNVEFLRDASRHSTIAT